MKRKSSLPAEGMEDGVAVYEEDDTKLANDGRCNILKKKKKLSKKDLLKPPTNEELNQLRETENLFHSNLFRLQIEEMFSEIKVSDRYVIMFKEWFQNAVSFFENLENLEPREISSVKWLKKLKVKLPLEQKLSGVKGVFQFVKPSSIQVIGSYEAGCCVGPNVEVDVLLNLPQKCFQRNDSLNHRYLYKRALYLAYVASQLKDSELADDVQFHYCHGNPLRPLLTVKPAGKLGRHFTVIIHAAPPSTCFKHYLFSPSRNNVRDNSIGEETGGESSGPPTPHYNSSVLVDLTLRDNESIRNETLLNNQNLKDGIKLLKIWLHQRELDKGYGAFSAYVMAMFIVYLAKERRISNLMSSYQVVRTAWNYLAASDWTAKGISLAQALKVDNSLGIENFHSHYEVVFLDATGFNNMCANMTKSTFMRVKQECQLAVKCLDNPNLNSFQALFMTKIPFYRQFDHVIRFYNSSQLEQVVEKHSTREELLDFDANLAPLALKIILSKVSTAVGKRTTIVAEQLSPPSPWNISEDPPPSLVGFALGIRLNAETAFDVIEKGPQANTPEALEFQEFWGSKSELRRFQDGSVCEAVLWGNSDAKMSQRRMVCKLAIGHILKSLGLQEGSSWQYFADQMETLIRRVDSIVVSNEEDCLAVVRATDVLSSNLRQLKDLPLDVTSVIGLSSTNRYTDPFAPVPTSCSSRRNGEKKISKDLKLINGDSGKVSQWIPHVEVMIQLGVSSKWPSNLDAIRRVKAAFHLKIADSLREQFKLLVQPYPEHIDVYQDGYIFRIYLSCPREISLLKEYRDTDGMIKYKSTEESVALEKKTVHLPKLSSALHGLQQTFIAYGTSCCLAKRWIASQLLLSDQLFPEICVELLVASLFLSPEPLVVPNQPQAAFIRFLYLIATQDWSSQLIILNFNEEMSRQDVLSVENNFGSTERTSLPPLVIATPYDRVGDTWTKEAPSVQVLIRLAQLARQALQVIEAKVYSRSLVGFKQIFRPALEPYDLVLHLHSHMIPRINEAVDPVLARKKEKDSRPSVKTVSVKGELPPVAFDPVQLFLRELQDGYSEYALFFYDCYGGTFIGVLWKPMAFEEKEIKVSHFNARKLNDKKSKLEINMDAIIEDFYIIGKGLVSNISMKCKKES
ncbi:nucleolar protein 6 [Ischnura elegans]|uniref:nucleolar protein 6 n=1 Tax=Ischnura elegans TaxID=197161 RepID=UPI001ED876DA|nr:nucleolar protein 6 [Ischnura elegans]